MLTAEHLRSILSYDPETGAFTWLISPRNNVAVGDTTGVTAAPNGYCFVEISGRRYRAHRLAWLYVYGEWPSNEIDHRNRVRHDNRWVNLRPATSKQNKENRSPDRRNKSGHRGISWHAGASKWQAHIAHKYLGVFADLDAAVTARKAAERELFTHAP